MKPYVLSGRGVLFGVVTALLAGSSLVWVAARQPDPRGAVAIDADDIGGVVASARGPEAGVWVIAETTELPTKFARIVVTDDQGRYVVPDLPRASYQVFVRGYGLADSARQTAKPGQHLNLKVEGAPDAKTAARVYPAAWWLSMLEAPAGADAQKNFAMNFKECYDCHQVGSKATREILPTMAGGAASSADVWERRTKVGPSGPSMGTFFQNFGESRKAFAAWSDRIAKGETPKMVPPRPSGVERNLVVTLWDWGSEKDGRSDDAASDTRNPTIAGSGAVYGVAEMTDSLTILDPIENKSRVIKVPTKAPVLVSGFNASPTPSPHFGADVWKRYADVRSTAVDAHGRVWMATRNRAADQQPPFCTSSSDKFAKNFPLKTSGRQLSIFDPKTEQFEQLDTCFSADHNQMSKDNFLYFGSGSAFNWIDMNAWEKTHDAEAAQGWCPAVVDTNGDGAITAWTEPSEPIDPAKDHRVEVGCYSISISPKDGSLWCSSIGRGARRLVDLEKGPNAPQSCRAEVYEPPPAANARDEVYGSGGVEVDSEGVVWQNWRASGHFSAFDRRKCRSTKDPQANGQSCAEGWTFYRKDDPTYSNSHLHANESYLTHMDVYDVLGLGKDAPMYGSVNTDAFEVLAPATKKFVTLRVPYPLGFFPRSANARIDSPRTGWKGKGLWASYASYATWHIEGGKGEGGPGALPKAVKFQMRPNPLAH